MALSGRLTSVRCLIYGRPPFIVSVHLFSPLSLPVSSAGRFFGMLNSGSTPGLSDLEKRKVQHGSCVAMIELAFSRVKLDSEVIACNHYIFLL